MQRSLPNSRYEELSGLRGVLKRKCIHLQPCLSHPWSQKGVTLQNVKWIVTLQNFRSPTKSGRYIIKIWYIVNQNSFTWTWRKINVVSIEKVSNE